MEPALPLTRDSFRKLHPIVAPQPVSHLPERVWTAAEWDRIRAGRRAMSMDEKWNVFAEGDTVFLHRSWTGNGIYEVSFAPAPDGGWRIASAVVETDPDRMHARRDDYDRVMIELVISVIVLGEHRGDLWTAYRNALASPGEQ